MAWYKEPGINGHILESGDNNFRLLYCPLCKKLVVKSECEKLKRNRKGELYPVKRYYYNISKVAPLIKIITK